VAANLAELLEQNTSACIAVAAMEGPHVPVSSIGTTLPVVYIVGPEGDFSTDEMGVLRERGALPLSLGRYTLRSETAASVGVTLIQQQLGALGGNEA
jgi:RsmE family RNA methyltransferase